MPSRGGLAWLLLWLAVCLAGLSASRPAGAAEAEAEAEAGLPGAPGRPLIVTNSHRWAPMAYLDEDGEPDGLLIDIWRAFSERTGIPVEFRLVNWSDSLDLIRERQADVHAGLFQSDKRDAYMDFSDDLLPLSTRLFVSAKLDVGGFKDLRNVLVGITRGGYEEEVVRQRHPYITLRQYENNHDLVEAAVAGEILAFVADYPVGMFFLHKLGDPEQFHVVETLYTRQLKVAVAEGDAELLARINAGLALIRQSDFDRITQKWMRTTTVTPEWVVPSLIVALCAVLVVSLVVYSLLLKRQVAARTRDLLHLSTTDRLTGIYNRLKLEEVFSLEFQRALRYGSTLSVILVDIDHFKQINDVHGHHIGDRVLRDIAHALSRSLRGSDTLGRWGGEEFLVLCPGTDLAAATMAAEKLRIAVDSLATAVDDRLSASFGVASLRPGDGEKDIFVRADQALYQAKAAGRNRVCPERPLDGGPGLRIVPGPSA
jgi:diguanylate cyclase (GGDEF)-like protein